MAEPEIELGEYSFYGNHITGDIKVCDRGKVYKSTPQKVNGMFHPYNTYYDATGALLPDAVTEWFWCRKCKQSTKSGELDLNQVVK